MPLPWSPILDLPPNSFHLLTSTLFPQSGSSQFSAGKLVLRLEGNMRPKWEEHSPALPKDRRGDSFQALYRILNIPFFSNFFPLAGSLFVPKRSRLVLPSLHIDSQSRALITSRWELALALHENLRTPPYRPLPSAKSTLSSPYTMSEAKERTPSLFFLFHSHFPFQFFLLFNVFTSESPASRVLLSIKEIFAGFPLT